MDKHEIANILKTLSGLLRGVSQRKLADELGISQSQVNIILRGGAPKTEHMVDTALVLLKFAEDPKHTLNLDQTKKSQLEQAVSALQACDLLTDYQRATQKIENPIEPLSPDAANHLQRPHYSELHHALKNAPCSVLIKGEPGSGLTTTLRYAASQFKDMHNGEAFVIDFLNFYSGDEHILEFVAAELAQQKHFNNQPDNANHSQGHNPPEIKKSRDFLRWLPSLLGPNPTAQIWCFDNLHQISPVEFQHLAGTLLQITNMRFRTPSFEQISFLYTLNFYSINITNQLLQESSLISQRSTQVLTSPFSQEELQNLTKLHYIEKQNDILDQIQPSYLGNHPKLLHLLIYEYALLAKSSSYIEHCFSQANEKVTPQILDYVRRILRYMTARSKSRHADDLAPSPVSNTLDSNLFLLKRLAKDWQTEQPDLKQTAEGHFIIVESTDEYPLSFFNFGKASALFFVDAQERLCLNADLAPYLKRLIQEFSF